MNKELKLDYSYHNHTFRCGHASGSDEDFIKAAIAFGIKEYGVSDHVFLPGFKQPGIRGDYGQLEDYLSSIRKLKTRYQKEIAIHAAFEAEYFPQYITYYQKLFAEGKVEYLILGQHGFFVGKQFYFYLDLPNTDQDAMIERYAADLIAGMASGLFSMVAHPDLFLGRYPQYNDHARKVTARIIEASIRYQVPLELNLGGMRYGQKLTPDGYRYAYPVREFWQQVAQSQAQVVIGIDAHNPNDFAQSPYAELTKLVGDLPLNYLKRVTFKQVILPTPEVASEDEK